MTFNSMQFFSIDFTGTVSTDRLKGADDIESPAVVFTREDAAAVEGQADQVVARDRHQCSGNGFITTGEGDNGIHPVTFSHQFDTVGDHRAAHQRIFHRFGAHGDAIRDDRSAKDNRLAAHVFDGLLDDVTERPNVIIARRTVGIWHSQSDDRFIIILIGKTYRAQHGPRSGSLNPLCTVLTTGYFFAATFHRLPHLSIAVTPVLAISIKCSEPTSFKKLSIRSVGPAI